MISKRFQLDFDRPTVSPSVDIVDDESGLRLTADLPGVSIEDVTLAVERNTLWLMARARVEPPLDAAARLIQFAGRDFVRSFILPPEVDADRIEATLDQGVLCVTLPRRTP